MDEFLIRAESAFHASQMTIWGLLILLSIWFIYRYFTKWFKEFLGRIINDRERLNKGIKFWKYAWIILGGLLVVSAVSGYLVAIGIAASVLVAVLAILIRAPISGLLGWGMIFGLKPFTVGDMVTFKEGSGEVIDVNFFHTTLSILNHGGKIEKLHIPNSLILEQQIINHGKSDDKVDEEFSLLFTYQSDCKTVLDLINAAIDIWSEALKIEVAARSVAIYPTDTGMKVTVRYRVNFLMKRLLTQAVIEDIIDSVEHHEKVSFKA